MADSKDSLFGIVPFFVKDGRFHLLAQVSLSTKGEKKLDPIRGAPRKGETRWETAIRELRHKSAFTILLSPEKEPMNAYIFTFNELKLFFVHVKIEAQEIGYLEENYKSNQFKFKHMQEGEEPEEMCVECIDPIPTGSTSSGARMSATTLQVFHEIKTGGLQRVKAQEPIKLQHVWQNTEGQSHWTYKELSVDEQQIYKHYAQLPPLEKYDEEDTSLTQVQVDGLVIIKMMKHSRENFTQATGTLLGLDVGTTLEITNCFPLPQPTQPEREDQEAQDELFPVEMMRCLRDVNNDKNVGWYSSCYMGNFVNVDMIEYLNSYQDRLKKAVVLIYDPQKTEQGNISLRAYRLSQKFLQLNKSQVFTKESLSRSNLSFSDIFQELPVVINNLGLVSAYLLELQEGGFTSMQFKELDLNTSPYLEKTFELLMHNFDNLTKHQNNFAYYQRVLAKQQIQLERIRSLNEARRELGQEPLPEEVNIKPEPSRLEYLLASNQIDNYCKQVDRFAANNLTKLFLHSSLWKN